MLNTCNQSTNEIFDSFATDPWLLSRKYLTVFKMRSLLKKLLRNFIASAKSCQLWCASGQEACVAEECIGNLFSWQLIWYTWLILGWKSWREFNKGAEGGNPCNQSYMDSQQDSCPFQSYQHSGELLLRNVVLSQVIPKSMNGNLGRWLSSSVFLLSFTTQGIHLHVLLVQWNKVRLTLHWSQLLLDEALWAGAEQHRAVSPRLWVAASGAGGVGWAIRVLQYGPNWQTAPHVSTLMSQPVPATIYTCVSVE